MAIPRLEIFDWNGFTYKVKDMKKIESKSTSPLILPRNEKLKKVFPKNSLPIIVIPSINGRLKKGFAHCTEIQSLLGHKS